MQNEPFAYLNLLRKWAWFILLLAFISGVVSFIFRVQQDQEYQAEVTILIGGFIEQANPESTQIRTGLDLAQTYAELITTLDLLQDTIDTLALPLEAEDLQEQVSVDVLQNTSLIVVSVNYTDPQLAADIANTIAEQLISSSPSNLTPEQSSQIAFLNDQIELLNGQLDILRQDLEAVNVAITNNNDPELVTRRNELITQINEASSNIAQFSTTVAEIQQRTNSLDVVERARVPSDPIGFGTLIPTLLGAVIGAVLAVMIVLFIEYTNNTVRTSEEADELLHLPVLGSITRFGKPKDGYPERLVHRSSELAPVMERYRNLQTNLMLYQSDSTENDMFLVTSPGPQEGKSITTANLATTMALSGLRVLLIDADMRHPTLHQIYNIPNENGLTDLIRQAASFDLRSEGSRPTRLLGLVERCVQSTEIENLAIIPGGRIPDNPITLLNSYVLDVVADLIRVHTKIDLILFDTPPTLLFSDSLVIAQATRAKVVLVLLSGKTRRGDAMKAVQQFEQVGIDVTGTVLNGIDRRDARYYDDKYYYYYQK